MVALEVVEHFADDLLWEHRLRIDRLLPSGVSLLTVAVKEMGSSS
jgi:hypothetical protein